MRVEHFFHLEPDLLQVDQEQIDGYRLKPLVAYQGVLSGLKSNSIEVLTGCAKRQIELRRTDLLAINREMNELNKIELREEDFAV